jgi:hypothetical protein
LLNVILLAAGMFPHGTVMLPGAVIVGIAGELTVMILETGVSVLSQASVAVHVSVIKPPQRARVPVKVERFEVPLIRQLPVAPLVNGILLGAGIPSHVTLIPTGAVIEGNAAGLTVMVRVTGVRVLPHASVAVQVSVTNPPHAPGGVVNVDGLEVPLTRHPSDNPLVNGSVLGAGRLPHATVISIGAVIVGSVAGLTVIVLDTGARFLPHASVAVQVSVTCPPHAPGVVVKVDKFDVPLIRHPSDNPLVNGSVLGAGKLPHATVVFDGAVMVGNVAGFTVIVLETGARVRPHPSVAVQVSVTCPPHFPGNVVKVERSEDPVIWQLPTNPLLKAIRLAAGILPQSTVIFEGAVIVGKVAGFTVIVRDTGARFLPHASVAVHVSMTGPPQAPGGVVRVEKLDVPLIRHPSGNPLVNGSLVGAGKLPHATVVFDGAGIVGNVAGLTVIVLDTGARFLPHASVAVQVSVTGPPHAPGVVVKVDKFEVPLIRHPSDNPLVNGSVLAAGKLPQATVVFDGAVMVGNVAGLTVIDLDTGTRFLPHASVAVQVSVTCPPHAPGVVVKVEKFDVPLIRHPVDNPLVNGSLDGAGKLPHATVVFESAVMVGNVAGLTVIVLDTGTRFLPHASVAVQVSVTCPPHAPGGVVKVDKFDVPLIKQFPVNPLVKGRVLAAGKLPQATVVFDSAVIVGNVAGLTVIVLDTGTRFLPHASVAVQVSVTCPPHAPGGVVKVDKFDVPLIRHPVDNPLVNGRVLGAGKLPHATVVFDGAVMVGNVAGLNVIVRDTGTRFLPQTSVAVQVSVTCPPHAPGGVVKVDKFDVPLIRHPSDKPLVNGRVLGAGKLLHATVVFDGAVIVGNVAGLTVIVLDTGARFLPHASVAVQVSVTCPPHAPGAVVKVDKFDVPLIRHPVDNPLLNGRVLAAGKLPQATVVFDGAVIVGNVAGLTVIVLDTGARFLPHASVAVQVSVTCPPHAPGIVVKVDKFDVPLIKQFPVNPLEYVRVLAAGILPHATVVFEGAVIVGSAGGLTVYT